MPCKVLMALTVKIGACCEALPRDLALGIPKTEEDFNKEFVQREWCQKIVGSTREDPALVLWFLKLDVC